MVEVGLRLGLAASALGLALGLGGCGGGAMQQGFVSDACKAGDPSCARSSFERPIALGASIHPEVHLTLRGSAGPGFHLESAAPTVLEVDGGSVIGRAQGMSALLFVGDSGTVIDFIHVWVKQPSALRLSSAEAGSAVHDLNGLVEMLPGESIRVTATPVADGQDLLGAGDAVWTVEPPIAKLMREGNDGERRVVAREPGHAVLRVKTLGVESTLDIVVQPSGRSS
jgi:hypothetical protein